MRVAGRKVAAPMSLDALTESLRITRTVASMARSGYGLVTLTDRTGAARAARVLGASNATPQGCTDVVDTGNGDLFTVDLTTLKAPCGACITATH